VPLFERRVDYDRKRFLNEAERARTKGRKKRAIGYYRRILAVEPEDPELNLRVAPLLGRTGQHFDAWRAFRRAAGPQMQAKNYDQALQIYQEAARCLPLNFEVWEAIANLERRMGRKERAREMLLLGRQKMKDRQHRPEAIALLRASRSDVPWDPEVVLDLARLLYKTRQSSEALWMLEQLAERCGGRTLRSIRALQWRITPSLRNTWCLLRAAMSRDASSPVAA
jgi:tetratricopeptide (TPR) repeat protein